MWKWEERKITFYEYEDQATIVVLQNEDEEVIASDVCNHPMYSVEQCIETVFNKEPELAEQLNECVSNGDLDSLRQVAADHDIYYEDLIIDGLTYQALLKYLSL